MENLYRDDNYPISVEEVHKRYIRRNKIVQKEQNNFNFFNDCYTKNSYGEEIRRIDGDIPKNLTITPGETFLFISYDQSKFTHGLHKYPAKFFPELPRWLINTYSSEGDMILDPFGGSATVNIEALLNNRNSVFLDIDPFAKFLAKVKVTPLDIDDLKSSQLELLNCVRNFSFDKVKDSDIPDFPYRDNWFIKEILYELAYIKSSILDLSYSDDIKDFYLIIFSSIIRSVSNADDNCTRTVIRKKLNKNIKPAIALNKFTYQLFTNVPKMIEFSNTVSVNYSVTIPVESDARDIRYPEGTFDLALTSPPYVNAVDYPRTHQLEIYWLGLAQNSLLPFKKNQIGTESVLKEQYKELHLTGIEPADIVLKEIFVVDERRAFIAYNYLRDMELNLREVYRTLKVGRNYIIVVGNNRIRNITFTTWKYLIEIAERIGFKLESYFGSEIIKHFIKVPRQERINTDWIIILRK